MSLTESHPGKSKAYKSASYSYVTNRVTVEHHDGTSWEYHDVPVQLWKDMMSAPSPGSFLNKTIKPRHKPVKA